MARKSDLIHNKILGDLIDTTNSRRDICKTALDKFARRAPSQESATEIGVAEKQHSGSDGPGDARFVAIHPWGSDASKAD
jgi:hypothetical protein